MPFNGSGTFVSLAPPDFPALPFTTILASMFNANMNDIFTNGLTKCITRDGQSTPTANLPMAGFKFTGLGNGSADTDSAALGQVVGLRGAVGVVDWDTRTSTGLFEATAASLTTPSANFPPTSDLGMLYVSAQGALVNHFYVTADSTYQRQKVGGTWNVWTTPVARDNYLMNADFDLWEYGTSQTSSGNSTDNRWQNLNVGSTKTASQQVFTIGQVAVPDNPTYFSRTVVATVANAANFCRKEQRIEFVETFSGETVTVSFWAKAATTQSIALNFTQFFGTGGSPSADINVVGQKVVLTTSWTRYVLSFAIPSISGKTLGTVGDYLALKIWFDAGSNFNSQTSTLGQQSGTFDLSHMKVERGAYDTPWKPQDIQQQVVECQRFKYKLPSNQPVGMGHYRATTTTCSCTWRHPVKMRVAPILSVSVAAAWTVYGSAGALFSGSSSALVSSEDSIWVEVNTSASGINTPGMLVVSVGEFAILDSEL